MTGLAFLAPLFLLGLAFLIGPVLVHLRQKDRKEIVEFPSLMFLQQIPYKSVRRQKIRHWLLLLFRLAALTALIVAFARPFLDRSDLVVGSQLGAGEIVIMVDRSYSMGYDDRWEAALDAARRSVRELTPDDRASLIFFSAGASVEVRSGTDRSRLLGVLDTVQVSSGITRFGPGLKLAQTVLEQSELPRKHVIVISDFQKGGWDGDEGVRFPEGATVTPIAVGGADNDNVAVAQVSFQRRPVSGRERVTASARLVNAGEARAANIDVVLELDGREVESQTVTIEPSASASLTFPAFTLSEPFTRGSVRVPQDALPADDAFHFVLSPGAAFSLLVVESAAGRSDQSLYLSRALAVSEDPTFDVAVTTVEAMSAADLNGRSVVILNGTRPPRGSVGERLREFVEAGGGLLVALGERSSWPTDAPDLLPGPFGQPVDRPESRGGTLGYIDYSHPVFELFDAPRSGDVTSARFFRYRTVQMPSTEGVLARFDNGAIALAERRVGQGRVLLWTSTLDNFWNDMALQPIFLPFVHQMTKHIGGFRQPTLWYTADEVLNLSAENDASGVAELVSDILGDEEAPDLVAISPEDRSIPLKGGERPGFLMLEEQGFYEIRTSGGGEARPPAVAVNIDLAESDLELMDPEELTAAVVSRGSAGSLAEAGSGLGPEDKERRQGFWWYLLAGAFMLLAIETAISNRLSRAAA